MVTNTKTEAAAKEASMTWNDYAAENKQCHVKMIKGTTQATRYEPGREYSQWNVSLPAPHGSVCCKTIEEARELASRYGCTIIL